MKCKFNKVYVLLDPDKKICYVGSTFHNIKKRYDQHIYQAKNNKDSLVHKWIKNLLDIGKKPKVKVLKYYKLTCYITLEESEWIKVFQEQGFELKNKHLIKRTIDAIE
jgi:hypothetical protein